MGGFHHSKEAGRYAPVPVWQSGLFWEFGEGVGAWLLHGSITGGFCVSLKGDRPLFASLAEWLHLALGGAS